MLLELVERALVTLGFTSHGAIAVVLDEASDVELVGLVGCPGAGPLVRRLRVRV